MKTACELRLLSLAQIGQLLLEEKVEREIAAEVLLERAIRKAEKLKELA